ncbi:MAG TPA: PAS domain S-box protein [Blastocatellia bacterium]|nr:PAS domain S-box protein [Blastocatellia bacterium]
MGEETTALNFPSQTPVAEAASDERRQAMLDSEALASIIASAMDAIITIGADQRIVLFNHAAEKMFLISVDDAIGQPIDRFIPERYRAAHQTHVPTFGATHSTKRRMGALGAIYGLRSNGEEFPIEASISHIEAGGQRLYTVILRDLTQRVETEARLREQAALLDHAQDAILVRDLAGHVLFWNKSAERIYGWPAAEVMGRDVREFIYIRGTDEYDKAMQTLMARGEWMGEMRHSTRDGIEKIAEARWTLVRDEDGTPKSVLSINTDVTERKKLETQFLRAQRMESLGTLAGGIAHDLNNILAPILMAVQLLERRARDPESQQMLRTLLINAERGADMVKQVLSFARGVTGEHVTLQPRHLVKEIVKILRETLPKSIEVSYQIPEEEWPILGDATQMHQVLMNLCVNARDAMPDGGKLTIKVENTHLDENYARMHLEARPGRYVVVTVADTGTGIPPHIIDKIFEPFFTTKEHGKGTGLGLSTVSGIVRGHGGFINVYSEADRGTQFRVFLPAITVAESHALVEAQSDMPMGQGEVVLVVDDEMAIREITRSTLEAFGYHVLTASDGTEAIAQYAQNKDSIQVVLTDMMMPYLDGAATIRALQKINPQVRIIASSGLTENGRHHEAAQAGVKTFLSKPYTAERLLKALAEILGRG